ncbi:MAG: DUF4430 domain-containing protein [Clostridia bacterium]
MKINVKKLTAALLCMCLLFVTAFAADYSPQTERYTMTEIVNRFEKLVGSRGGTQIEESSDYSGPTGSAYICADAFVLGSDYILYPMRVEIESGDNAAMLVTRTLEQCGLYYENSGSVEEDFYLSRIRGVELNPSPETELVEWLEPVVSYYEPESWQAGSLGEFDFTDMSGWMFFVNGEMPSVSMSGYEVRDGDVISLRFTLAGGMDLGGESFFEDVEPYVENVNRDEITKAIADGKLDYAGCAEIISKAGATQEEIDELLQGIY